MSSSSGSKVSGPTACRADHRLHGMGPSSARLCGPSRPLPPPPAVCRTLVCLRPCWAGPLTPAPPAPLASSALQKRVRFSDAGPQVHEYEVEPKRRALDPMEQLEGEGGPRPRMPGGQPSMLPDWHRKNTIRLW